MQLLDALRIEKRRGQKGGIYHQTQIKFAYNSNRIEGSHLSSDQTRYIFETHTFLPQNADEVIWTDDIIETLNHFAAFDYLLDVAEQPLTEDIIKRFHAILKTGTQDSLNPSFAVGDYKKLPNMIGDSVYTSPPKDVPQKMQELLQSYAHSCVDERALIDFHYRFEKIHPFQDGNGRVGRLILFKECLYHHLVPFIIDADHKLFYYRGLKEYPKERGWLVDTCLDAQDRYSEMMEYFQIEKYQSSIQSILDHAKTNSLEQYTELDDRAEEEREI